MRKFWLSNTPVPEGHVVLLALGAILHIGRPLKLFKTPRLKHALGWPLLLLGVALAAWAVVAARNVDIARPTRIIDSGPYRFSRNPMYVAWTLIYVGMAALINSWWLLLFLPALIAFTHYCVVRQEERQLEQRFGTDYRQYRDRVGRYW